MQPEGPAWPARGLAVALGAALAMLAGCLVLGWAWLARGRPLERLADPELRRELLTRLAQDANALNDSHPDAEVARVLAPEMRFEDRGVVVSTNRMGMREREYALPKPPGTVRLVLLGDSFVFGLRCSEEERLGGRLEQLLRNACSDRGREVEVLSLGVSSWNMASEIAYLRRQVDRLEPDLVLHLTVPNDLADVSGVRGFGTPSSFAPLHPERADAMVGIAFPPLGVGWESRTRYAAARAKIQELSAALARMPSRPRYVLVAHWGRFAPVLRAEIGRFLDPDSVLYSPLEFCEDESTWLGPENNHWNASGHERMARILRGWIGARKLLPELALASAPDLEREAESFAAAGLHDAEGPCREAEWLREKLPARLDLRSGRGSVHQVHAGIDGDRLASPYVSILLGQPGPARELCVRGRALPDSVLEARWSACGSKRSRSESSRSGRTSPSTSAPQSRSPCAARSP